MIVIAITLIAGLLIVLVVVAAVLDAKWKRGRITGAQRAKVLTLLKQAGNESDPLRRVLEADKVLDAALTALGFGGTTGEKLKRAQRYLRDPDALWRAHKLRNRIAHEHGVTVSPAQADEALRAIAVAVQRFCR